MPEQLQRALDRDRIRLHLQDLDRGPELLVEGARAVGFAVGLAVAALILTSDHVDDRGVEAGLALAVAAQPGLAQEVAGEALAAGGKRLRPLLCFLTARDEPSPPPGVAVEMVHMATLVHDDLVDGARLRRGLPAAWSVYGADAAKAAGDYLFACAFAVLAETGDERQVRGSA